MNPLTHEAVVGKTEFDREVAKQVKLAKVYHGETPKVVGKDGDRVLVTG